MQPILGRPHPLQRIALALATSVVLHPSMAAAQAWPEAGHGQSVVQEALPASNASQVRLSEHLRQRGFVFYGAWWCPACRQQKRLFGEEAARRLPYQECEQRDGDRQRCDAVAIRAYPTWIHGRERREGVLSLEELRVWSGWQEPTTPGAGGR